MTVFPKENHTFLGRRRKRISAHTLGVCIIIIKYNVGEADDCVNEQVVRLMKQMIAPAEVSWSWMSVSDDSVVYQSAAKFPLPARPVCSCFRGAAEGNTSTSRKTQEPIASSSGEDVLCINIKIVLHLRNERRRAIKCYFYTIHGFETTSKQR